MAVGYGVADMKSVGICKVPLLVFQISNVSFLAAYFDTYLSSPLFIEVMH